MHIQVFPEYYDGKLQGDGLEIYGEITSDRKSRMSLAENGEIKVSYDKICSDGKNVAGDHGQNIEIFVTDIAAIGLVCCMDVNNPQLLNNVKRKLDASGSTNKIICISAHMSSDWFGNKKLPTNLHGYLVVLSNGNPGGVDSFIAGVDGMKLGDLSMNIENLSITNNGCT